MTKSKKIIIFLSIIAAVGSISFGILIWAQKSAAYKQEIEAQIMDEEGIRNVDALKRAISLYLEQKQNMEICRNDEDGNRILYYSGDGTNNMNGTGWLPLDFTSLSARDSIISSLPMSPSSDRDYTVYCDHDGYVGISTQIYSDKYISLESVIRDIVSSYTDTYAFTIYEVKTDNKYAPASNGIDPYK